MSKALLLTLICSLLLISTACASLQNTIAVISLDGPIQIKSGNSLFGGAAITPDEVRKQLERAESDIAVRAIVIQVNSPGGDVSACQEIVYAMNQVKKPVVISMRSVAASGGYYISAKANRIIALPSTLTGSIGVISEIPNLKGLFDKIGLDMQIIKAGKYKDMYSGTRQLTEEELSIWQKTTDQMYEQFIDIVAEGRHLDKEKVRELATGQLYTGIQAKDMGLVDELGGIQTAVDAAAALAGIQNPNIQYYQRQAPGLFNILSGASDGDLLSLLGGRAPGVEELTALYFLDNTYPRLLYK